MGARHKEISMSMKLLVVDDEAPVVEVLKAFLEPTGSDVVGLTDSLKAAECVEREKFDGIILDVYGIGSVAKLTNEFNACSRMYFIGDCHGNHFGLKNEEEDYARNSQCSCPPATMPRCGINSTNCTSPAKLRL
jgi:DNA-binding NarL/FixJ family response regulator